MRVKPINGYVVLQPVEETLPSGIVIPDQAKQETDKALVVAVDVDSILIEGQEVYFKKYSGEPFKMDGEQYIIIGEEDILATVN